MKKRICSLLVACFLVISTTSSLWAIGNLNDNEKEVLAALKSTVEVDGSTVGLQDADINTAENYMMQDGFDLTSEQKTIIINNIEATKSYLAANHIKDFNSITRQQAYDILDKLIYTTTQVIKRTGYDMTQTVVIASGLVIILLGAGYYAKRKQLFCK